MKAHSHFILTLVALLMLTACGGRKNIRITEGNQPEGSVVVDNAAAAARASIVHVDSSSRLATIRNGHKFDSGDFLIVQNREGQQTGILKALPKRPLGLRTADILEGNPDINNTVVTASPADSARLAQIYRDSEE